MGDYLHQPSDLDAQRCYCRLKGNRPPVDGWQQLAPWGDRISL